MGNPFDHFWTFLWEVVSHVFTLLAGCAVTVLLNYIEKHTKFKMTLRHDIFVLAFFAFFACFQAWHDQYRRADTLEKQLGGVAPLSDHSFDDAVKMLKMAPFGSRVHLLTSGYDPQVPALTNEVSQLFTSANEKWTVDRPTSLTGTSIIGSEGPQYAGLTCGYEGGNLDAFRIARNALGKAGLRCPELPAFAGETSADITITIAARSTPDN